MDLYEKFSIPAAPSFALDLEIYFLEGHSELRLIVSHHLSKQGFKNLRSGRSGHVALAELVLKPASIVIAGDSVTDLGPLDLIKELREDPQAHRPAFLLLSKSMQRQEIMLAIECGIDDFLIRPIAPADVLPKMRIAYQAFSNPQSPERVYEYAKSLIRAQDYEGAKQVYLAVSHSAPKAARPIVGLARIAKLQGKLDAALDLLDKAILSNTHYVHAFELRAQIHASRGNSLQAFDDFKSAIEISPLNILRYQIASEFLISQQLMDETIQLLRLGLSMGVAHPYVSERLGYCYFVIKDYVNAQKYLKLAIREEPTNWSYLNSLAICYRDALQYDSAIDIYNKIIKNDNDNYQVLFNKAVVQVLQSKIPEATKTLALCLKINPDFQKAKDKLSEIEVKAK